LILINMKTLELHPAPVTCAQCGMVSHAGALDQASLTATSATLAALADPIRLGIVELLSRHDRMCVCDIMTAFAVGQPTISHHLRVLREAGIVDAARRGPWAYYGLKRDALKKVAQDLVRLL
jgi:ArsR family transcriptional regulator